MTPNYPFFGHAEADNDVPATLPTLLEEDARFIRHIGRVERLVNAACWIVSAILLAIPFWLPKLIEATR